MEAPPALRLRPLGLGPGAEAARAIVEDIRPNLQARGVAFSEIAEPSPGTHGGPWGLRYDPGRPDGQRTTAVVGDTSYLVEAPDWILLPAAVWVNDRDVGVLTAGGRLRHPQDEPGCRMVANYAPAIDGTLIGLRLLQADMITNPGYSDLFQYDGHYLLGMGELAPTPADISARDNARHALEQRPPHFRSYVLTDAQRTVRFTLARDKVVISGQPVYRLWNSLPLDPLTDDGIDGLSEAVIVHRANAAEKTLLARLAGGPLEGCAAISNDGVRNSARLARQSAQSDEDRGALRELEAWVRVTTVVQVPDHENPLSDPRIIEPLNSTVYKAVGRFAQLAAFFRYVQANHPDEWTAFVKQVLPARAALSSVVLPTCIPANGALGN